jgi:Na+-translocating ferredoxin:NAD+ oxidoreductase RnfD subunit
MIEALTAKIWPLVRFCRTPKGTLLLILGYFIPLAAKTSGINDSLTSLLTATFAAALLDLGIVRLRQRSWIFPDGAILTGLIVAFVLRTQEPWPILAATASIAVISKHLLRTRWSNVFNPAALAIVASSLLFDTGQSWWGALPDLGLLGLPPLFACGIFIVSRINKLPLVLAFLGAYLSLFTIASWFGDPSQVAEVFRSPDLQACLFFAFFMLDDPPTCPTRYEDQFAFGVIVATSAYFLYMTYGVVYFLAAGLLVGNTWESSRRILWRALASRRRMVTPRGQSAL